MIVRDYDSKNVLKDLIRVLERASFETCAFIEIRLELREINELLTELYKIPNANEAEPQTMKCCGNCEYRRQSKLTIQFNEEPLTAYCDNKNSPCYDKYIWDTACCAEWKGASDD